MPSVLRRTVLFVGLGLALAASNPRPAPALEPSQASSFVRDLGERAIDALKQPGESLAEREQALGEILRLGFDLPLIARLSLGAAFRQLNDGQRVDYERLFGDFVLAVYSRRLNGYAGEKLDVGEAKPLSDTDVLVSSQILRSSAAPIKVDWRVRESKLGLRIIDVIVEGVSMVLTQRNEFQSITQQNGIDGLLLILQSRVEQASAQPPGGL